MEIVWIDQIGEIKSSYAQVPMAKIKKYQIMNGRSSNGKEDDSIPKGRNGEVPLARNSLLVTRDSLGSW